MRCALVAKRTCARVVTEHWERKNRGYQIICEYFQSVMPCLPEHLFSLNLICFKGLKADISRSC